MSVSFVSCQLSQKCLSALTVFRVFYGHNHNICKWGYLKLFSPSLSPSLVLQLSLRPKTSEHTVSRNGEGGKPCLHPGFSGNAWRFSLFRILVAAGLWEHTRAQIVEAIWSKKKNNARGTIIPILSYATSHVNKNQHSTGTSTG